MVSARQYYGARKMEPVPPSEKPGGIMLKSVFVAASALSILAASTVGHAETLKFAIGQKGAWTTSMVDYGTRQGFFKKEGIDTETFWTEGGAPTVQAVLSGSADIAIDTGILGVIGAYSKGAPLRIISANSTGAPDIYWYAKTSSGIKSLKDAAGKTIGFSENGSSSNLVLLALLQFNGIQAKTIAAGGMPSTMTQVQTGQIDVGWAAAPFGLKEVGEGQTVVVAHGNDVPAIRNETVRVNVVSASTLASKHDALVRFMRAYKETIEWAYKSPQAVDYLAEANHISKDIAAKAIKEYYPREEMQLTEIKSLDLILKQALDNKYVPHAMTAADVSGLITIIKP
jgi:NitT/TauT family transport system substrate-binding protein